MAGPKAYQQVDVIGYCFKSNDLVTQLVACGD